MKIFFALSTLLLLVAGVIASQPNAVKCPRKWTLYDETTCLLLVQQKEPWDEARNQCDFKETGADLAVLDSVAKKSFVHTMIHADPPSIFKCSMGGIRSYWIGAHDVGVEGEFEWLDTSKPLEYTDWDANQPDNQWEQDCVLVAYKTGKWRDVDCTKRRCFLCETPAAQ